MPEEIYKNVAQEATTLIQKTLDKLASAGGALVSKEGDGGVRLFFPEGIELIYVHFKVGTTVDLTVAIAGEKAKYPDPAHPGINSTDARTLGGQRALRREDNNECNATVAFVDVSQETQSDNWNFTFNVVEGVGPNTVSSGTFQYSYRYFDGQNIPHPNNIRQGPSWAPGDGHATTLVDTVNIPGAVSVDMVEILSITSGGCTD